MGLRNTAIVGGGGSDGGLAAGWGPPMANILVTGLPWGKEVRAEVKRRLKEAVVAVGPMAGLTWGNRKGTCFIGMETPAAASTVIVRVRIENRKTNVVRQSDFKTLL